LNATAQVADTVNFLPLAIYHVSFSFTLCEFDIEKYKCIIRVERGRNLYNHVLYLVYWLVNSAALYLFSFVFTDGVILGNYRFNPIESALYAGFWVTVFLWAMWDFVYARGAKLGSEAGTDLIFWGINSVAVWLVSRFSHIAGFGISSFLWAFILGGVVTFIQRLTWKMFVEKKSKSIWG